MHMCPISLEGFDLTCMETQKKRLSVMKTVKHVSTTLLSPGFNVGDGVGLISISSRPGNGPRLELVSFLTYV